MKVVGYIKIQNGLTVTSDCLSKSFEIKVNGIKGILKTPSLPTEFNREPSFECNNLNPPDCDFDFSKRIPGWGQIRSLPDLVSTLRCVVVEFNFRSKRRKEEAEQIIRANLSDWIIRFRDNLYAYNYNIDYAHVVAADITYNQYSLFLIGRNRANNQSFATKKVCLSVTMKNAISHSNLKDAIDKTSANKKLILEYLLIKDSEMAVREKNYRKAILDIATSFEVCLANYLRRNLKCDKQLIEELLSSQVNSLSKRRGLVEFSGMKLPKHDYVNIVDKKRNQAIHGGKIPSEIETKDALKVVKEVLEKLTVNKFE